MSDQEKLLKQLAVAIEDIIIAQNNQPPDKRSFGKLKNLCKNCSKNVTGVDNGLSKVLDLAQQILKDGSLCYDYKGLEECRTFVLNENSDISDLFGSASIEGWLQLHLSSQVQTFL